MGSYLAHQLHADPGEPMLWLLVLIIVTVTLLLGKWATSDNKDTNKEERIRELQEQLNYITQEKDEWMQLAEHQRSERNASEDHIRDSASAVIDSLKKSLSSQEHEVKSLRVSLSKKRDENRRMAQNAAAQQHALTTAQANLAEERQQQDSLTLALTKECDVQRYLLSVAAFNGENLYAAYKAQWHRASNAFSELFQTRVKARELGDRETQLRSELDEALTKAQRSEEKVAMLCTELATAKKGVVPKASDSLELRKSLEAAIEQLRAAHIDLNLSKAREDSIRRELATVQETVAFKDADLLKSKRAVGFANTALDDAQVKIGLLETSAGSLRKDLERAQNEVTVKNAEIRNLEKQLEKSLSKVAALAAKTSASEGKSTTWQEDFDLGVRKSQYPSIAAVVEPKSVKGAFVQNDEAQTSRKHKSCDASVAGQKSEKDAAVQNEEVQTLRKLLEVSSAEACELKTALQDKKLKHDEAIQKADSLKLQLQAVTEDAAKKIGELETQGQRLQESAQISKTKAQELHLKLDTEVKARLEATARWESLEVQLQRRISELESVIVKERGDHGEKVSALQADLMAEHERFSGLAACNREGELLVRSLKADLDSAQQRLTETLRQNAADAEQLAAVRNEADQQRQRAHGVELERDHFVAAGKELEAKLSEAEGCNRALRDELATVKRSWRTTPTSTELETLRNDLHMANCNLVTMQESANAKVKIIEAEIISLKQSVLQSNEDKDRSIRTLTAQKEASMRELFAVQNQTSELFSELESTKAVLVLSKDEAATNLRLTAAKLTTAERAAAEAKQQLAALEDEANKFKSRAGDLQKEIAQRRKENAKVEERMELLRKNVKTWKEVANKWQDKYVDLEKYAKQLESKVVDMEKHVKTSELKRVDPKKLAKPIKKAALAAEHSDSSDVSERVKTSSSRVSEAKPAARTWKSSKSKEYDSASQSGGSVAGKVRRSKAGSPAPSKPQMDTARLKAEPRPSRRQVPATVPPPTAANPTPTTDATPNSGVGETVGVAPNRSRSPLPTGRRGSNQPKHAGGSSDSHEDGQNAR
ncbi:hypothetical protein HDU96_004761 [Phlyctochytrium bullatum]|nr:hypothetical protein HDU96_004761 [Phlyctochytrium bullatum]